MNHQDNAKPRDTIKVRFYEALRWLTSITFFFLAISKTTSILETGLKPYLVFLEIAGFPLYLKYYGVFAVIIELFLAIGLWDKRTYITALMLTVLLMFLGVSLSVYSITLKLYTDCGCGLLGNNEVAILAQKLIITLVLIVLLRGKQELFDERASSN